MYRKTTGIEQFASTHVRTPLAQEIDKMPLRIVWVFRNLFWLINSLLNVYFVQKIYCCLAHAKHFVRH